METGNFIVLGMTLGVLEVIISAVIIFGYKIVDMPVESLKAMWRDSTAGIGDFVKIGEAFI